MGGTTVQEQMELLRQMQELDQELNAIRASRGKLSGEEADLGADLARVQGMVDSLVAEVDALRAQRRELTQALAQEQDNVQKAEGRLPAIKTQKEYVAVLKEIDTAKKLNKEIHERIAAKDQEIAALAKDQEEKEAELAALTGKVEGRRAEIAAALAECDGMLAEKEGRRESLLGGLPVPVRKRYQTLLERRGGVAVVEARRGTCLGCNMQLPPQLFNSLYSMRELQSCPHCNRLLYVISEP